MENLKKFAIGAAGVAVGVAIGLTVYNAFLAKMIAPKPKA